MNTPTKLASAAILWALAPSGAVSAQASDQPEFNARHMLGSELCRSALNRMAADPLTVEAIETAVALIHEALELDPDNPDLWRIQLEIASAAEREELILESMDRLIRLDGTDEVLRLQRLKWALDRHNTVEDRLAAMQRLLTPENIERIGPAVASRLELDLALLHRRAGDNDAFAAALTRALALDSSNRSAAALAAGYFRLNINDPVAEAELLVNLMMADPTDVSTQVALAQHLLENGAYNGARRMYQLAIRTIRANWTEPTAELLMDQAVALWASGDDDEALQNIRIRQQQKDTLVRTQMRQDKPEMSALDLMPITAPIEPTMGAVRAAILASRNDPGTAAALEAIIGSNQALVAAIQQQGQTPDPAGLAQMYLEMALLSVWLGRDLAAVETFLAKAGELQPLSDTSRARFEGWLAFRRGELDKAIELLAPIADADPPARCGLALAQLDKGQAREAAANLLAVARNQPGTLIGVWAARELFAVLGRRANITPQATQLEQLIASISVTVDRYPEDSSLALRLKVIPQREDVASYDPVVLNIELTNQSFLPLALDKSGPIRPQLLLAIHVNSAFMPDLTNLPPLVIDVGRRLRLMPQERLVVPVDIRRMAPGRILNALAVNGALLRITVISNFIGTRQGLVEPGALGTEINVPLIRMEGVRSDAQWLAECIAAMQSDSFGSQPRDVVTFAQVCLRLSTHARVGQAEADPTQARQAGDLLAGAFARLSPVEQAWALCVIPLTEITEPVLVEARTSTDRLVQLAYLVFKTQGPTDPLIAQLKASEDQTLVRLASLLEIHIRQVEEARLREAARQGGASLSRERPAPGGTTPPASPGTPPPKP